MRIIPNAAEMPREVAASATAGWYGRRQRGRQSRKRSATDAVKERLLQPQRMPPAAPAASPTVVTVASQQQPAAVVFRQPQLGAFFSAAPAPTQAPDSMDTD